MQVPLVVRRAVGGTLVNAHRVRERNLEQAVVARGGALQDVGQAVARRVRQAVNAWEVPLRDHHRFERPNGPERDHGQEAVVLFNQAFAGRLLEAGVLAQQTTGSRLAPRQLRYLLLDHFVGKRMARPDLAVRMRIAGAHHGAAIFEDLYVVDGRVGAEFSILLDPRVHNLAQVGQLHTGDSQVMARRETYYPADARLGFGDEEPLALETVWRRPRFERCKIVIEDECRCVVRISFSAGARVAGAEVALRIVIRLAGGLVFLQLPLPGSLRAVRRNQHPFASQWIEAAVRVLVPIEHESTW